jgi:hypothetical protein
MICNDIVVVLFMILDTSNTFNSRLLKTFFKIVILNLFLLNNLVDFIERKKVIILLFYYF